MRQSGDSKPPKHSVVCLTKYIPYEGITHAGGEYLQSHVRALSAIANVELVAPATPLNLEALTRVDTLAHISLLCAARPRLRGFWFQFFQVEATLAGCSIYWPVRQLFRRGKAPWASLESAAFVELQWSEMISLASLLRRRLPNQTLVGVAHDINTQRWRRQASQANNFFRRWLSRFIAWRTRRQESRSFAALDRLIVFSEKDAQLARELAPLTRVEVVHPGFKPKSAVRQPSATAPMALFVGAMNRAENEAAALWFLENVWPGVLGAVPNARFVIAGAKPNERLIDAVARASNVEITGFVESLTRWYDQATVCVVPLRTGAGVKFKTIDAMLAGVAVVTTSVGVEGIDADGLLTGLTDDADEFGRATIAALRQPNDALTERARQWAESTYGEATFTTRLHEVYGSLLIG